MLLQNEQTEGKKKKLFNLHIHTGVYLYDFLGFLDLIFNNKKNNYYNSFLYFFPSFFFFRLCHVSPP